MRILALFLLSVLTLGPVRSQTPANNGGANRELVVATKEAPPFVVREGDGWGGLSMELWRLLAERLGVKARIVERDLQGMIDDVAAGKVDLAIAAITMTPEREQRLDFSHPFLSTGLGIATRGREQGLLTALADRLFSLDLLSALSALLVVLTVCGLLVWLFERRRNPQFAGKGLRGPGSGFWFSAVTMTTVGYGDKAPVTLAGRLVALVWMFTSIVIISGYTASIASALTLDRLSAVIRGPDDLANARIGTLTGSAAAQWLDDRHMSYRGFGDLPAALQALEDRNLDAVVYDIPLLSWSIGDRPGLRVLPHILRQDQYAIALPPGSELRKDLNRSLLEVMQTDRWSELRERWLGN